MTPPSNAIETIIRAWWNDACRETWREAFADPARREALLDDLAARLTTALAPLRARILCLTAAAGILQTALEELWRWACTDAQDGIREDPRVYVRQVCHRAFSNPVVERVRRLRHPDDSGSPDPITRIAEVLTRAQRAGGHIARCPAAILQTLPAAECSLECRAARALLDVLRECSTPTRRA